MKKKILITYLIAVHILLLMVLCKPDYVPKAFHRLGLREDKPLDNHTYYMEALWQYFANRSKTIDDNSEQLIFLGNSITNGLCVENIFNGINFGISGESVLRAKSRIKLINNLSNKRIFLAYGINDIPRNLIEIYEDYVVLIGELPKKSTIYLSSILPVNEEIYNKDRKTIKTNKQIKELNKLLKDFAETRQNIHYLDTAKNLYDSSGQLKVEYQKGDGIHLNFKGNMVWSNSIKNEIEVSR